MQVKMIKKIAADVDDQVVGEEQDLPPDQPVDVHAQRRGQVLDQALVGDEDLGALADAAADEGPDDEADEDVGQLYRVGCRTARRRGCPARRP